MMGRIQPGIRGGLLELFYAVYEKDANKCLEALVTMGVLVPTGDLTAARPGPTPVPPGPSRSTLVLPGSAQSHPIPNGPTWSYPIPNGPTWSRTVPLGLARFHSVLEWTRKRSDEGVHLACI